MYKSYIKNYEAVCSLETNVKKLPINFIFLRLLTISLKLQTIQYYRYLCTHNKIVFKPNVHITYFLTIIIKVYFIIETKDKNIFFLSVPFYLHCFENIVQISIKCKKAITNIIIGDCLINHHYIHD